MPRIKDTWYLKLNILWMFPKYLLWLYIYFLLTNQFIFLSPWIVKFTELALFYTRCVAVVVNKINPIPVIFSTINCLKLCKLLSLNYLTHSLNTLFVISLKSIIMGPSSQFHDGIHSKIRLNLMEVYHQWQVSNY